MPEPPFTSAIQATHFCTARSRRRVESIKPPRLKAPESQGLQPCLQVNTAVRIAAAPKPIVPVDVLFSKDTFIRFCYCSRSVVRIAFAGAARRFLQSRVIA